MEPTAEAAYAARLGRLQLAGWKERLRRVDPYGIHLRYLRLGTTLEVGCGIGRNLWFLRPHAVGVDHNPTAIEVCRSRALPAWLPDELGPAWPRYDSLLFSHVLEHLDRDAALEIVASYLGWLVPGGRVVIITPQERGYRSDPTHVRFVDHAAARDICLTTGLRVLDQRTFPFPARAGRLWLYNEYVTIASLH